jgi:hypothetical protein
VSECGLENHIVKACSCAGGMCGFLLPAEGDPCPTVVPTPFRSLGEDISANATCSALYANPPHQKHISRPLDGQGFEVPSPPVLARFCTARAWGCEWQLD